MQPELGIDRLEFDRKLEIHYAVNDATGYSHGAYHSASFYDPVLNSTDFVKTKIYAVIRGHAP